jgi:hypothetical protein
MLIVEYGVVWIRTNCFISGLKCWGTHQQPTWLGFFLFFLNVRNSILFLTSSNLFWFFNLKLKTSWEGNLFQFPSQRLSLPLSLSLFQPFSLATSAPADLPSFFPSLFAGKALSLSLARSISPRRKRGKALPFSRRSDLLYFCYFALTIFS